VFKRLTKESVESLFSESLFRSEEKETEGKEDLDVRVLLEDGVLHLPGVLQVGHADGVVALSVTNSVQGVQNNALGQTEVVGGGPVDGVVGAAGVTQNAQLLDAVNAALAKTTNLKEHKNNVCEKYKYFNFFICT